VLRESHRTRTVFRKVGGFVYVTSLLVAMEKIFVLTAEEWLGESKPESSV